VRGEGLSGLEGLLTVVGLEVTMEGIRTGTSSERRKERVTDCRGCNDETAGTTELCLSVGREQAKITGTQS